MGKVIIIIRHAKASWKSPLHADIDRTLTEQGERDAIELGAKLFYKQFIPDLILSSPAKRALETARLMAHSLRLDASNIQIDNSLYQSSVENIESLICSLDNTYQMVFIIGHNPELIDFVNSLSSSFAIENLYTCGVVAIETAITDWSDFNFKGKQILFFDYPKTLHAE